MGKDIYIGVDNVARKVIQPYIGVDNVARTITKSYIGVDNVARLCYEAFNAAEILIDFNYVDNGDGTYTLTGWKGTLNGMLSTELVVPDYPQIIL